MIQDVLLESLSEGAVFADHRLLVCCLSEDKVDGRAKLCLG